MIVFIDWISTPNHANFNNAFFNCIELDNACCYVFDDKLQTDAIACRSARSGSGRFNRFLAVRELCRQHRGDKIIFLTYDPVLLPLTGHLGFRAMVFEHNTTPETKTTKHAIWQKLFFHRFMRLTQFPAQQSFLEGIGQKSLYVGSPLQSEKGMKLAKRRVRGPNSYFIAPSHRASLKEIVKLAKLDSNIRTVVKKTVFDRTPLPPDLVEYLIPVDRIDLTSTSENILGIIITVSSRLRGTGWFNDAVAHQLPIVISNHNAMMLYIETFPGFPYVALEQIDTANELFTQLEDPKYIVGKDMIFSHNQAVKSRFMSALAMWGW